MLGRLAAASRGALLITRVGVVCDVPSFVVLQRAGAYGYATEYLGWVFNRDELIGAARGAGLELRREFLIHDPFPIEGAPAEVHHRGFLFSASGDTGH